MCRRNCEVQSKLETMPLFVHCRSWRWIEILYDRRFLLTDLHGRYSEGGAIPRLRTFDRRHFIRMNAVEELTNERPTWYHLLFYFTYYGLNMFRTLIDPSSGACDCVDELPHWSSCSQFVVCWRFGAAGFGWCSFCRLNWEHDDRCGTSTTQTQAPDDGYINVRNMLST